MNWSNGGDFTKNLLSLQMQLQTLLEGVGGEETAGLLDGLAKLSETERSILIPLVTRVINKVVMGEHRLMSEKDKEDRSENANPNANPKANPNPRFWAHYGMGGFGQLAAQYVAVATTN